MLARSVGSTAAANDAASSGFSFSISAPRVSTAWRLVSVSEPASIPITWVKDVSCSRTSLTLACCVASDAMTTFAPESFTI